jgi:phosphoribosyl-dephospho-CoA transferase
VGDLARHDLVWLGAGWRGLLRSELAPELARHVENWWAKGRPFVRRRRAASEPADVVPLGLALPLCLGRTRIAFAVERAAVERTSLPLRLGVAVASAPVAWRPALVSLDAEACATGVAFGVYGSLAWQHLSGETCVTAASDVDLLVTPRSRGELERTLALLAARATDHVPRLDGEVVLTGGGAVAWRELLGAPRSRLLVKSADAVALLGRDAALASLEAHP